MSSSACCEPSISRFRHRITIQNITRAADGQGGWTRSWATFQDCWAEVKELSAREVAYASSLQHRITHKVVCRYVDDIASDMRISYDNRILEIRGYRNPDGRKRFWEIMCEEQNSVDNQSGINIATEGLVDIQTEAGADITTE